MRLVEVVMLMGAHCVSPVEHSQMMTDAAKVQCAVVIEKDTEAGTLTVTPQAAAQDPQVAAAVARFAAAPVDPANADAAKIVPAWAPAGSSTTEVKLPPARPPVEAAEAAPPAMAPSAAMAMDDAGAPEAAPPAPAKAAPAPEKKVAVLSPPPQKPAAAKAAATTTKKKPKLQVAAAPKGQCNGTAVARWYKTSDGSKRFRCVKPAGDSAPVQLY